MIFNKLHPARAHPGLIQSDYNKRHPYFMASGLWVRTKVVLLSFCSKFVPFFLDSAVLPARCYSHGSQESDEEFDARWVTYFNKPDIDAWELRKGMLKVRETQPAVNGSFVTTSNNFSWRFVDSTSL